MQETAPAARVNKLELHPGRDIPSFAHLQTAYSLTLDVLNPLQNAAESPLTRKGNDTWATQPFLASVQNEKERKTLAVALATADDMVSQDVDAAVEFEQAKKLGRIQLDEKGKPTGLYNPDSKNKLIGQKQEYGPNHGSQNVTDHYIGVVQALKKVIAATEGNTDPTEQEQHKKAQEALDQLRPHVELEVLIDGRPTNISLTEWELRTHAEALKQAKVTEEEFKKLPPMLRYAYEVRAEQELNTRVQQKGEYFLGYTDDSLRPKTQGTEKERGEKAEKELIDTAREWIRGEIDPDLSHVMGKVLRKEQITDADFEAILKNPNQRLARVILFYYAYHQPSATADAKQNLTAFMYYELQNQQPPPTDKSIAGKVAALKEKHSDVFDPRIKAINGVLKTWLSKIKNDNSSAFKTIEDIPEDKLITNVMLSTAFEGFTTEPSQRGEVGLNKDAQTWMKELINREVLTAQDELMIIQFAHARVGSAFLRDRLGLDVKAYKGDGAAKSVASWMVTDLVKGGLLKKDEQTYAQRIIESHLLGSVSKALSKDKSIPTSLIVALGLFAVFAQPIQGILSTDARAGRGEEENQ